MAPPCVPTHLASAAHLGDRHPKQRLRGGAGRGGEERGGGMSKVVGLDGEQGTEELQ